MANSINQLICIGLADWPLLRQEPYYSMFLSIHCDQCKTNAFSIRLINHPFVGGRNWYWLQIPHHYFKLHESRSQAQLRMTGYWWGTAGSESPGLTWCILSRSSWERSKRCRRESRSTSSAPPLCGSRTHQAQDRQATPSEDYILNLSPLSYLHIYEAVVANNIKANFSCKLKWMWECQTHDTSKVVLGCKW